jgi:predicted enzyme related to lactoylglutathione lyase
MGVFRPAGVSYLRIPAPDPKQAAVFYELVFGWKVDTARAVPNFEDGSGDLIGHFVSDIEVARGRLASVPTYTSTASRQPSSALP